VPVLPLLDVDVTGVEVAPDCVFATVPEQVLPLIVQLWVCDEHSCDATQLATS
jgi:hypothetical protein